MEAYTAQNISTAQPKFAFCRRTVPLKPSSRQCWSPFVISRKLRLKHSKCLALGQPLIETDLEDKWGAFSEKCSGEWDGYSVDFSPDGSPLKLPENVVPQAYHDWGLDVFDWQSQAPTDAKLLEGLALEQRFQFYLRNVRLLPTVGCEADASTLYSVEEKFGGWQAGKSSSSLVGGKLTPSICNSFFHHESGSFVATYPGKVVPTNDPRFGNAVALGRDSYDGVASFWDVEFCLPHDSHVEVPVDSTDSELRRIRFICSFARETNASNQSDTAGIVLKKLTVYREIRDSEFRNGVSLASCGQKETNFAESKRFSFDLLKGSWKSESFSAISTELDSSGPVSLESSSTITEEDLSFLKGESTERILLPKEMFCEISRRDASVKVTCGWMPTTKSLLTSSLETNTKNGKKVAMFSVHQRTN